MMSLRGLNYPQRNLCKCLRYILKAYGIRCSVDTLKTKLFSHVDFPSMVTLGDVLNELHVSTMAVSIAPERLKEIPLPAVAHLVVDGGLFVPIIQISDDRVQWYHTEYGPQEDSAEGFAKIWSGSVLLIQKNSDSGEPNYVRGQWVKIKETVLSVSPFAGVLSCLVILLFVLFSNDSVGASLLDIVLVSTSVVGLFISLGFLARLVYRVRDGDHSSKVLERLKYKADYIRFIFHNPSKAPPVFHEMRAIQHGNTEAEHTLTVVLDPLCHDCGKTVAEVIALVGRNENIKCQILLTGTNTSLDRSGEVARKIFSLPSEVRFQELVEWYNVVGDKHRVWDKRTIQDSSESWKILDFHRLWCDLADIGRSPVYLLDGVRISDLYAIHDTEWILGCLHPALEG